MKTDSQLREMAAKSLSRQDQATGISSNIFVANGQVDVVVSDPGQKISRKD